MNEFDACETAYKNGYEAGKKDAVKHGRWTEKGECSVCHEVGLFYTMSDEVAESDFCPWCGARMDGGEDA